MSCLLSIRRSYRNALCALLLSVGSLGVVGAQTSGEPWQIKTNLTGFLSDALSLEVERSLGPHLAVTLQGGAIINLLELPESNRWEGFFLRAGAKWYLLQKARPVPHTGLAVKLEMHYSYWQDWYTNLRGNFGNRWENSLGGIATVSYTQTLGRAMVLEPFVGIGYIPVWESYRSANDIAPFNTVAVNWSLVPSVARRSNYFSHFTLSGDLVVSAGLSFGFRF
ncbi:MAG: DUF3575 domain-containing protein [Bacteroidota bacterium]